MNIGILGSGSLQSGFLHETGGHDHLGAVLTGQGSGIDPVVIGSVAAVGGLIVLVGLAVGIGVELHAVVGALVEGLVLQGAHVGDESHLVLAVGGSHLIGDVIRGSGSGGSLSVAAFGCGCFGSGRSAAAAAGGHANDHHSCQKQSENLFHNIFPPYVHLSRVSPVLLLSHILPKKSTVFRSSVILFFRIPAFYSCI